MSLVEDLEMITRQTQVKAGSSSESRAGSQPDQCSNLILATESGQRYRFEGRQVDGYMQEDEVNADQQ
jgi:hypothetical protein